MAWDKLTRALNASIDKGKLELLTSTHSLPLKSEPEKKQTYRLQVGNVVMEV